MELRLVTYTNVVPEWPGPHSEIVLDVKISVAIGLSFDKPWTEAEWIKAVEENVLDKISWGYGWFDPKNDLEWEILEIERDSG